MTTICRITSEVVNDEISFIQLSDVLENIRASQGKRIFSWEVTVTFQSKRKKLTKPFYIFEYSLQYLNNTLSPDNGIGFGGWRIVQVSILRRFLPISSIFCLICYYQYLFKFRPWYFPCDKRPWLGGILCQNPLYIYHYYYLHPPTLILSLTFTLYFLPLIHIMARTYLSLYSLTPTPFSREIVEFFIE